MSIFFNITYNSLYEYLAQCNRPCSGSVFWVSSGGSPIGPKIEVLRSCCKIHQHYLNISKTFRLFRKSYIGVYYGPDIKILVSEFTTFELARIANTSHIYCVLMLI